MQLNDYQKQALTTAIHPEKGNDMIYPALGLVNEAGEVAGKIKKLIRDKQKNKPSELTNEELAELAKEIGDVLWYTAVLCDEIGYSLEDVAQMNVEKLKSRQARNVLGGSGDDR